MLENAVRNGCADVSTGRVSSEDDAKLARLDAKALATSLVDGDIRVNALLDGPGVWVCCQLSSTGPTYILGPFRSQC